MKLYELQNITHQYQGKAVLNFSHLEIKEGEIIGISGKNGSGKSTLLRLLAFLESPTQGKISYFGESLSEIAILLPEVYLLARSVRENLEYMFKIRKKPIETQKIKEVLELVGLEPKLFLERSHLRLSSGERQRVGLAQRLLLEPRVLLLDEPTNSLDSAGLKAFSQAIWWANERFKSSIITISHDKKWLDENSKRRLKLHFGRLIAQNQANLLSHNWSRTYEGEKYYEFGQGIALFLPKSQELDVREGICIAQEHILVYPLCEDSLHSSDIFEAQVIGIRLNPQEQSEIILECQLGDEVLRKILPRSEAEKFKLFDKIGIIFDLKGILQSNEG